MCGVNVWDEGGEEHKGIQIQNMRNPLIQQGFAMCQNDANLLHFRDINHIY